MVLHGIVLLALAHGLYLARHLPTLYINHLCVLVRGLGTAMIRITLWALYSFCTMYGVHGVHCIDHFDGKLFMNWIAPATSSFILAKKISVC